MFDGVSHFCLAVESLQYCINLFLDGHFQLTRFLVGIFLGWDWLLLRLLVLCVFIVVLRYVQLNRAFTACDAFLDFHESYIREITSSFFNHDGFLQFLFSAGHCVIFFSEFYDQFAKVISLITSALFLLGLIVNDPKFEEDITVFLRLKFYDFFLIYLIINKSCQIDLRISFLGCKILSH